MSNADYYKPYSQEIRGDLFTYIKTQIEGNAVPYFSGFEDFFKIIALGLIKPTHTAIRISRSPAPDIVYFVNNEFMLESRGTGEYNMSAMGAEKGVYDPKKVLAEESWTITGLNESKLYKKE